MKAPFPYFGSKALVASRVWEVLGNPPNYVEPFFGSGAVLLARPGWNPEVSWIETVNDKDGFISNFWRAVQADPEAVAYYMDWPVNENDLHARHIWLVNRRDDLTPRLEGDPDFFDAKVAGWWCWGASCWISGGWCSGNGPWNTDGERIVRRLDRSDGVSRQRVHLGDAGQGVHRQRVHLGDAGRGVQRQRVHLRGAGAGVHRKLVHLSCAGVGVHRSLVHLGGAGRGDAGSGEEGLFAWIQALCERLRRVRVCSGDWSRIMGPTPTITQGLTGVFLDPPYSLEADRNMDCYAVDDGEVAHAVREWCLDHGGDPRLRIVLCGYRGEHDELEERGWRSVPWKAHGGYSNTGKVKTRGQANRFREVLWLSPHCLSRQQGTLFEVPPSGDGKAPLSPSVTMPLWKDEEAEESDPAPSWAPEEI